VAATRASLAARKAEDMASVVGRRLALKRYR